MGIRIAFSALVAVFFWCCNKDKIPEYSFIVQGKIINSDNGQGVSGIKVYCNYGEPCCIGLAKKLGSDSVRTDAQGRYKIQIFYPEDTLIYRFITYLKASRIANKFYYYSGEEIQDIGVTAFDQSEMIIPGTLSKLPDGYTHTCNFEIIPIGLLRISFKEPTNPVRDTILLKARRLEASRKVAINMLPVLSHHRTCRSAYGGS